MQPIWDDIKAIFIGSGGGDVRIIEELTAECPRKRAAGISDPCHARYPDLPKVV
jgi:hypothetical protein